jgi:hypothetical protein
LGGFPLLLKSLAEQKAVEDPILFEQVDYGGLLVTLNPASDGDDQQY